MSSHQAVKALSEKIHSKSQKIYISVSTTGFGWLRSIKLAKSVWKTESVPTSIHSFCQIGQVNEWMFIHFDNLCRLTRSTQIDKVCVEDRVSLAASQHPFIRVGDQCVTKHKNLNETGSETLSVQNCLQDRVSLAPSQHPSIHVTKDILVTDQ